MLLNSSAWIGWEESGYRTTGKKKKKIGWQNSQLEKGMQHQDFYSFWDIEWSTLIVVISVYLGWVDLNWGKAGEAQDLWSLTNLVKSLTINFVEDLGASSSSAQDMSQTQMTSGKAGKAMLSWQKGSCFKLTQSCSKAKLELWIPLQYIHT